VPLHPPPAAWRALLELALAEDLGAGDVTSGLVLPEDALAQGAVEARQPLVVCGLRVATACFHAVDAAVAVETARADGSRAEPGDALLRLSGPARAILAAERTAINFLTRMAGVATWTRRFVERVAGTGAAIVDTRKTLPGWRALDKYAVSVGGGVNHRAGLYDAVLVKDNHAAAAGGVGPAVKAARAGAPPHLWIQAEVESEADAEAALAAGADALLLDNRSVDEVRRLVARFGERTLLEVSGGITLENVRAYAETGVPRISIGALTHSAPGADVALELAAPGRR
jgi:nicotinate-nucleotide pyrophosphorylase (carboxylating)